ncbi:hypothetical protein FRB94_014254 [Tulasnella sp. JGI-2019a]|nr:hypothetical protein FRB94_014254 [Tulasnella sp. JGI-2019a]
MHLKYGPAALAKLRACYGPKKKINAPSTGNTVMFYTAAYDLGVSGECLIEYTMFASHKMVACPKRTLAAPVRRRGELSSDWLAVELRCIAYSGFDSIRNQMEGWRTQPEFFFKGLLERAESTILSPGIPEHEKSSTSCKNGMQSRLHISHLQYAAWLQAAAVFEYFDEMGWTNPAVIINAFMNDNRRNHTD